MNKVEWYSYVKIRQLHWLKFSGHCVCYKSALASPFVHRITYLQFFLNTCCFQIRFTPTSIRLLTRARDTMRQ